MTGRAYHNCACGVNLYGTHCAKCGPLRESPKQATSIIDYWQKRGYGPDAPQFTPGPWIIERSVMGCRSITSGDDLIASVEDAPSDANARLIAAAPKLFALAVRAEVMLPMAGADPAVQRLIDDLQAIIAEVRGEA